MKFTGQITANFSWDEATKSGSRLPPNAQIESNIIRAANAMEEIRELFDGKPIIITSWYRTTAANRAAGGASHSRHLIGDAVDFLVQGIPPLTVHDRLDAWWGDRGGLGRSTAFTHIDLRGSRARWNY